MPTAISQRSSLAVVFLVVLAVVFGLRAVPDASTPSASASVCSVPVLNLACDLISGTVDGVKVAVSKSTGIVRDAVSKKLLAVVTKVGCTRVTNPVADRLGGGVLSDICSKVTDWLANKLVNASGSSGSSSSPPAPPSPVATGGGGHLPSTAPPAAAQPADGTPASAWSTGPMAALAGAATLFIASHVSAGTKADLLGGWFQPIYRAIEGYAWAFGLIAVAFGGLYVMVAGAVGKPTGLFALFTGIPKAALLMLVVPVLAMAGIAIIDSASGDLMSQFPDGTHLLHAMAAVLAVLAGTSTIAGVLGHGTIAHFSGAGAWAIAFFGLLTAGAVALELIAREVAIYLTVLIVPLAAIGEIFAPFAGWAMTLAKVLFAIIVTKLLLAIGLVAAGALAMAGLTSLSPVTVIVALVTIGLMTLFPVVVYGALLRVGESTWHGQATSAATRAAFLARQHSLSRQVVTSRQRLRPNPVSQQSRP